MTYKEGDFGDVNDAKEKAPVVDFKTRKVIEDSKVDPAVAHQKVVEFFEEMKAIEPASIGAFALVFDANGTPAVGGFRGVNAAKVLWALNAYMASFIQENLGD